MPDVMEAETIRPVTARAWLRLQTADAHTAVDDLFARFDTRSESEYGGMLAAHAAALLPIETWLDRHAGAVLADWPERRRGPALRADLAALDTALPAEECFEASPSPAAIAGILYVLEGSRFGGRVIARGLPPGLPRRYLDPAGAPNWPSFLAWLEDRLVADDARAEAATAAAAVFARFLKAGTARPEPAA
ncbi:biliverdin-producing heme oxygenase [Acidisoma sp. 7E03]